MTPKKRQHEIWDKWLSSVLATTVFCELCHLNRATDKAHRLKRDLIGWRTDDDQREYFCAAKVCRECHKRLDEGVGPQVHKVMFLRITEAILRRPEMMIVINRVTLREYVRTHGWDEVRIYGKRDKVLAGESTVNKGLKPMIKTFCDDCGLEIHGNKPPKEYAYQDSVASKNIQLKVAVTLSVQSKNHVICTECADDAYRSWLSQTAKIATA